MPYIPNPAYRPPPFFRNGHWSTIYSGLIKKVPTLEHVREKWELPDGDFLLVDVYKRSSQKAVILCHGLEGSSESRYTRRSAQFFAGQGFSVFAWNNRSCGGMMNRLPKLYHHGEVKDLNFVVQKVIAAGYRQINLLGFSMGGAQIMNYFGTCPIDSRIKAGIAASTPIQLKSSALRLEKGLSKVYLKRFISKIRKKVVEKAQLYPDLIPLEKVKQMDSFSDLAQSYIVPVYGFKDLDDFYTQASPAHSMAQIKTPVLVLNAWNDPIIGPAGFPVEFAKNNPFVYLETPKYGGHCAFPLREANYSYIEERALAFFQKNA